VANVVNARQSNTVAARTMLVPEALGLGMVGTTVCPL